MNMYLVVTKRNYGAIDYGNYSCHDYHIIKISSPPYTFQSDLNIDVKVVSSSEMVCEGTYYFPIIINYHYYASPENKPNNTIASLRTIINGNVNVKFYDSNDVVPSSLRNFSQNDFSSLTPIHVPIKDRVNIMDENN